MTDGGFMRAASQLLYHVVVEMSGFAVVTKAALLLHVLFWPSFFLPGSFKSTILGTAVFWHAYIFSLIGARC